MKIAVYLYRIKDKAILLLPKTQRPQRTVNFPKINIFFKQNCNFPKNTVYFLKDV